MKKTIAALLLFAAIPALAAEDAKPAPTCGKTVEECQKAWDADEQKIRELNFAVQGATQQRDVATKGAADAQLQAWVSAQSAPKK